MEVTWGVQCPGVNLYLVPWLLSALVWPLVAVIIFSSSASVFSFLTTLGFFSFLTALGLSVKKDEASCLRLKVTYNELGLFVGLCFSPEPAVIISHTSVCTGTVLCHFKLFLALKENTALNC